MPAGFAESTVVLLHQCLNAVDYLTDRLVLANVVLVKRAGGDGSGRRSLRVNDCLDLLKAEQTDGFQPVGSKDQPIVITVPDDGDRLE